MLLADKQNKIFCMFVIEVTLMYFVGWLLLWLLPACNLPFELPKIIHTTGMIIIAFAGIQMLVYIVYWCLYHKIYKGAKYAFIHAKLIRHIRRALLDTGTGYAIEEYSGMEKVAKIPKVKVTLTDDLIQGTVYIRNHIKYHTKLENVNISSALGRYIVLEQYISDDMNYYIYEIEDSRIDRQLVFNSYSEFQEYCKKYDDYILFMDSKNSVRISSLLLVGGTGSGKTYSLYTLCYEAYNWSIPPDVYYADPKNSSLVTFGNHISPSHTAGTVEEIILLLEKFHSKMQERKIELKDKLNEKLDADFSYWNMPANILIIDEFSSFVSVVNSMDKKTRDNVNMLLRNITLQGRQLGHFLWICMQKSDSSDIPTAVRNNLIWHVVLGQAQRTTLLTAFEETADLPQRKFGLGQGLFSYMGLTRQPQVTSFPTLNFDILEAVKSLELDYPLCNNG